MTAEHWRQLGWLLFIPGMLGGAAVFALYPAWAWLRSRGRRVFDAGPEQPLGVDLICAVRNGAGLIAAKLANLEALERPAGPLQVWVASDGSTDATAERVRATPDVRLVELERHQGKAAALNAAVDGGQAEILVFSDADALLEPDALVELLRPFVDPRVGGVCGRRVVAEGDDGLAGAQRTYVGADSGLKAFESRGASITSNDGKLHAIRRELFRPIPDGVTDDLFTCLAVVDQGYRFVYRATAVARIRLPSRSRRHELSRRRRIVARSLNGIWICRSVLDPRRTGGFAVGLLVNKVLRRLLPLSLLLFAAGAAALSLGGLWLGHALLLALLGGLLLALADALPLPGRLARFAGLAKYLLVGIAGTWLGLWDFLRGARVTRWEPEKGP